MRIARQLALIAAVAVTGFGAVATVDLISRVRMDTARAQFEEGFEGHLANTETLLAFRETRLAENSFIAEHQEKTVTDHAKTLGETIAGVEKLAKIHKEADIRAVVAELEKVIKNYGERFGAIVAVQRKIGLTYDTGLLGALRQSVHGIEGRIENAKDNHLSALMLTLRRHEKDFLARNDQSYLAKMDNTFVEFVAAVDAARTLPDGDKREIRTLADTYLADFKKVAAASFEIAAAVSDLNDVAKSTVPLFDKLRDDGLEDLRDGQAAVDSIGAQTQLIMNVCMAAVGIFVVLLVWFIARGISRPVIAMTDVMTKLAHGDKAVVIPGADYGNEIGAMASAVQVFKDNMIKAESLAQAQIAEQKAKEVRAEKVAVRTSSFDGVVATALKTLSSAGVQLEGSAQSMQATAEETNAQSSAVAAASEQASANVQTVAVT